MGEIATKKQDCNALSATRFFMSRLGVDGKKRALCCAVLWIIFLAGCTALRVAGPFPRCRNAHPQPHQQPPITTAAKWQYHRQLKNNNNYLVATNVSATGLGFAQWRARCHYIRGFHLVEPFIISSSKLQWVCAWDRNPLSRILTGSPPSLTQTSHGSP